MGEVIIKYVRALSRVVGILILACCCSHHNHNHDDEAAATIRLANKPPRASLYTGEVAPGKMVFHRGPVMTKPVKIYFIWYGDWGGKSLARPLLPQFISDLAGSTWLDIMKTYTDSRGATASTSLLYGGSISLAAAVSSPDRASGGLPPTLVDSDITSIIISTLSKSLLSLPASNHDTLYFVLLSKELHFQGMCTNFCAWHGSVAYKSYTANYNGAIRYSVIGDPNKCLSSCAPQSASPNGDAGADAMVALIAHEIAESITDPDLNSWFDANGYENADKCRWTWGDKLAFDRQTNSYYNFQKSGRKYLVPQNWNNKNNTCAM